MTDKMLTIFERERYSMLTESEQDVFDAVTEEVQNVLDEYRGDIKKYFMPPGDKPLSTEYLEEVIHAILTEIHEREEDFEREQERADILVDDNERLTKENNELMQALWQLEDVEDIEQVQEIVNKALTREIL